MAEIRKTIDREEYRTTLGDGDRGLDNRADASVLIGGRTEETGASRFVPEIRFSKWGGLATGVLRPRGVTVNSERPDFRNGRIELTVSGVMHTHELIDNNRKLMYQMHYASAPPRPYVDLDLIVSENVQIVEQLSIRDKYERNNQGLRWDQFSEIYSPREDWVVNSFVGFINSRNNGFKTGKLFHLPAFYLIDRNGVTVKCVAVYDPVNETIRVIFPQDFINNAVYPIRLDPILGYDTAGASNKGFNTIVFGSPGITDGTGGTTETWHGAFAAASGVTKFGLYNTADDGGLDSPKDQSLVEQVSFSPGVSDDESTTAQGSSLSASTAYYLSLSVADSATKIKYDDTTVSGDGGFKTGSTHANEMLANYGGSHTFNDDQHSIWIVYGAGGVTTSPWYHYARSNRGQ